MTRPVRPFNLMGWIEDNRERLEPPMLNKPIWRDGEFIAMILKGPVLRADYHVNPYEEFFYQLKGNMVLRTIVDGRHHEVAINEGDVFLLPPEVPHSPHRPEPGSLGLVIELQRPAGVADGFEWYCESCATRVHRCEFHIADMAVERPRLFGAYYDDIAGGTCPNCGAPNPNLAP